MEQETKAKAEGGQEQKTPRGQDGQPVRVQSQRPAGQPQKAAGRPQGTVYGQNGQMPPQRAGNRPQGTIYGQTPPPRTGVRPQAAGGQGRVPYGQNGQPQRVSYGQGGQTPPRRPGGRPQGAGSQGQRPSGGQAPYQEAGGRPPRTAYGQAPPQRAGNRPQGNPYDQRARMQAAGGGQPAGPYRQQEQYMQGTLVQRRDGRAPGQMMRRPVLSGRQLMEQSKKRFRSPLFFIMAVLCTVFAVTTLASVFLQELSFSQVVNILANFDAPSELMAYANRILSFLSGFGNGVVVFSLVLHLPELLLCVGLWMLFATAGGGGEPMPGRGFLCAKIYILIKMIMMCIALLICLILSVVLVMSAWMSAGLEAKIISAVFLAVMVVITMMIVMYFFCLLHTVSVCRMNAVQGEEFSSVSRYAAVLTILAALTSVIGLLSAIVNNEMAGIVSFACKIGWMVLAGLWILLYRNKINRDEEEE